MGLNQYCFLKDHTRDQNKSFELVFRIQNFRVFSSWVNLVIVCAPAVTFCHFRQFHHCNHRISFPRLLHCLLTCIPFPHSVHFHRSAAVTRPDRLACWPAVTSGNDPPAYVDPGQISFKAPSWLNLNVKLAKAKLKFCDEMFSQLLLWFKVQRSFNELDTRRRFPQSAGRSLNEQICTFILSCSNI